METILKEIQDCFLKKEKYFIVFAEADTRIEGWFKAELILLLSELKKKGRIKDFQPESKNQLLTGYKKIDFCVFLNDEKHLFKLKALCISQKATDRNLNFYFRE